MLETRALGKRFGQHAAVRDVSIEIREGEFFSLLGPSGCGKTTLLRMIGGLETPSEGQLLDRGQPIGHLPPEERPFNMVFQRYALFPHLTVAANVAFGLRMRGTPEPEASNRVAQALALVHMSGYEDRAISTLSGGQGQRVALARALVNRPRVLLLDEPLSALDLKLRQQMQVELLALQRRLGHTFVLVTHDQDEALSLSDRVAVMNEGRVVQVGTPREIYDNPATPFVAGFIGSMNQITGVVESAASGVAEVMTPKGVLRARFSSSPERGGEAILLVRPEAIRLEQAEPQAGINRLRATVREVMFQGPASQIVLDAGGATLTVSRPSAGQARAWKSGDEVWAAFSPVDTRLSQGERLL